MRELVVVVAIGFVLWVIARPSQHIRENTRGEACDRLYVGLNAEIATGLERVLRDEATACGTRGGPAAVVDCLLATRTGDDNPRNRNQTAYTRASVVTSNATSCRVGLLPYGTNGVKVAQWFTQTSPSSRSFSVVID